MQLRYAVIVLVMTYDEVASVVTRDAQLAADHRPPLTRATIDACLECSARLVLVGSTLIVTDNRNCGGMNVNFDGLYHRKAPKK